MRLTELEPQFLVREDERTRRYVDTIEQAQGITFLCPACHAKDGHSVMVWFRDRGVPHSEVPGPGRWAASGFGYHDLSLAPSIQLLGGCNWHGFVTAGEIR